ncbi:Nucleosome assembly protein 1 [Fasciolopsis buskii]|uniref:Nucleosome assembly protein 1 n=1 Tax=Fasciolopsis buskii TaxID=27845 RepID=A0A8E0VND8_9TREM|nr:Nucleosome assembly protein 1 [Fasciolopsis buski]
MGTELSLPAIIKGRVRALKRIQYETLKLEVQFYKEIAKLENRFVDKHKQLFDKRKAIVSGEIEPSEEETKWYFSDNEETECAKKLMKSTNEGDSAVESSNCHTNKNSPKGIPGFWLTVLKHAPLICDIIRPADIPALTHLTDIRTTPLDNNDIMGFQLEFEFEPNEYFTNKVLTKRYYLGYELREDNPLSYDGPEVTSSEGCNINWNPDRDLRAITSSKINRTRIGDERQSLNRSMDSFFQFFYPPQPCTFFFSGWVKAKSMYFYPPVHIAHNPVLEQQLLDDYDLGQYIKERVIPRAVMYFTGETLDMENEVDDPDEFPDDDLDDDSDEDVDDGEEP